MQREECIKVQPADGQKELSILKAKDVAEKMPGRESLSGRLCQRGCKKKDTEQKMTEENAASEMEIPYEEDSGCVIIQQSVVGPGWEKYLGKPKDQKRSVSCSLT